MDICEYKKIVIEKINGMSEEEFLNIIDLVNTKAQNSLGNDVFECFYNTCFPEITINYDDKHGISNKKKEEKKYEIKFDSGFVNSYNVYNSQFNKEDAA